MTDLAVEPTATAAWHEAVRSAAHACDTRLDEALEAYLVFTLIRFSGRTDLGRTALALSYLEGQQDPADRAHSEQLRATGDECLLLCGLFPERARRRSLPFSYYVGLGRGAYHTLACTGAVQDDAPYGTLARRFVRVMELLQAMRDPDPDAGLDANEAATMACQTGSTRAWERAAPPNARLFRRRH